jgi:hypothetical protein
MIFPGCMMRKYNFSIDIEKNSKWMNIKKGHEKDTLKYSYKEKIDYIVKKVDASKETILLAPKCFKLFDMQSISKKSIEVIEYYYELEQLVDRYKNYIIDGMKDKIKKLENNQIQNQSSKRLHIYRRLQMDMVIIKSGKTKNLKKRLNNYNANRKDDIIPLYILETDSIDDVEK